MPRRATSNMGGKSRLRLAIDLAAVVNLVGTLGKYLGLAALFPIVFALGYREPVLPFLVAGAVTSGGGYALERATGKAAGRISVREGFLVVALTWLLAAGFAVDPDTSSKEDRRIRTPSMRTSRACPGLRRPARASSPTSTRSTARSGCGASSRNGSAAWGSLCSRLPCSLGSESVAVSSWSRSSPARSSPPCPSAFASTARRLWFLYVALTVLQTLMLTSLWLFGRVRADDALSGPRPFILDHADGRLLDAATLRRGVFGESQWILALFMLIAGANFALMYRALVRPAAARARPRRGVSPVHRTRRGCNGRGYRDALGLRDRRGRSRSSVGFFPDHLDHVDDGDGECRLCPLAGSPSARAFRAHVRRGSAGSTGGSIKVVRHLLLGKILRRELGQTVSPELVVPIRLNGAVIDERSLRAIATFILLYVGAWVVGSGVIAIEAAITGVGLAPLDALATSATALGNVGPAFGVTGPMGSFAPLGDVSNVTPIC